MARYTLLYMEIIGYLFHRAIISSCGRQNHFTKWKYTNEEQWQVRVNPDEYNTHTHTYFVYNRISFHLIFLTAISQPRTFRIIIAVMMVVVSLSIHFFSFGLHFWLRQVCAFRHFLHNFNTFPFDCLLHYYFVGLIPWRLPFKPRVTGYSRSIEIGCSRGGSEERSNIN